MTGVLHEGPILCRGPASSRTLHGICHCAQLIRLFVVQVRVLRTLHHRNIVQFYGACLEPSSMFFVTELMKVRGTLIHASFAFHDLNATLSNLDHASNVSGHGVC